MVPASETNLPTLGVLLAGGRGTRLGLGKPKALIALGGRSLVERALETLAVASDRIAVVAPQDIALPAALPGRRVIDAGEGPLGAMVSALETEEWRRAIVLGIDFPLMRAVALRALATLLDTAEERGADAVVAKPGGIPQPLAAVYGRSAREKLAAAWRRGERSPKRALGELEVLWVHEEEIRMLPGAESNFFNLNDAADLAEAERRIGAGRIS